MDILSIMVANPWLTFFVLLLAFGLIAHIVSSIKDAYINTIWCIRGIPPVIKFDSSFLKSLDEVTSKIAENKKEDDDENKLKDCR